MNMLSRIKELLVPSYSIVGVKSWWKYKSIIQAVILYLIHQLFFPT